MRPIWEPIVIDEHFGRRLEVLLDEAEKSGPYIEATKDEFDAMEREALAIARRNRRHAYPFCKSAGLKARPTRAKLVA